MEHSYTSSLFTTERHIHVFEPREKEKLIIDVSVFFFLFPLQTPDVNATLRKRPFKSGIQVSICVITNFHSSYQEKNNLTVFFYSKYLWSHFKVNAGVEELVEEGHEELADTCRFCW